MGYIWLEMSVEFMTKYHLLVFMAHIAVSLRTQSITALQHYSPIASPQTFPWPLDPLTKQPK